ncbi:MAG: acyltransferase family protein [Anaerolineae bacterium]|nr:acyltransferase family protein [Anaerolineae bacterium]
MTESTVASVVTPDPSAGHLPSAGRRHELDVLSTLIVFGLMFFHTATIFSGQQLVVNRTQSRLVMILASLVASFEFVWVMPVMMFIAGIAICYSLRRRTTGEFVRERLLRLGLPFLTGLVIANPPQVYYYLKAQEGLQESFLRFYPRYWNIRFSLRSFPYFLEPAGAEETFNVIHLWFLIFLLVYTLLLLPLLMYLRGRSGQRVVEEVGRFFSRRFAIFLWAIPIALLEALVGAIWPSGWSRWIWPFIIVYGYLSASDQRLTDALVRHRVAALIWGVVGFLVFFMGMGMLLGMQVDPWTDRGLPAMALRFVKGVTCWFLAVGVVGMATHLGQRLAGERQDAARGGQDDPHAHRQRAERWSFWERVVAYGREAQLPYYVLHQTPIIIIGYYVVQWNIGVIPKFLLISLSSLALALLVYEFVIRRIPVVRFLFGMRPRR